MPLDALRPLTDRTLHYGFITSPDEWTYLAPVYDAYTRNLSGYAVRDEQSWRSHISAQLAEGNIAVCLDGDRPVGYLFYQLGEPTIVSGEFVYATARKKEICIISIITAHKAIHFSGTKESMTSRTASIPMANRAMKLCLS